MSLICSTLATSVYAQTLPIIPRPLKESIQDGSYTVTQQTAIRYPANLKNEATLLAEGLKKATGVAPKLVDARLRIAQPSPNHRLSL